MSDQMFFVRARGRVTGPFDIATLRKLVQRGTVSRIDQVSSDRTAWSPAGDFDELFPAAIVQRTTVRVAPAATADSWEEPTEFADEPTVPFMADSAANSRPQSAAAGPAGPAGQYRCTQCRGFFESGDVYNNGGQIICKRCYPSPPVAAPLLAAYPAPVAYAAPVYAYAPQPVYAERSARYRGSKDKTTAILLCFFLGGIGVHKFYLDQPAAGIFYLLFCWTGIPSLIALVELIILICMDSRRFDELYNR